MIIITDKSAEKTVYFPKNIYKDYPEGYNYKLILVSRGSNQRYEFDVTDQLIATYAFYSFKADFSECPDGEYEYTVESTEDIVTVPDSDFNIEYNKVIGSNGVIADNYRYSLYKLELTEADKEYDFYFSTRYRGVTIPAHAANYMDGSDNIISGEYDVTGKYTEKRLDIPEGTKAIWFNAPAMITIGDYFTVIKKKNKHKKVYSNGIIRINSLEQSLKAYDQNRNYVVYDKQ